VTSTSTDWVGLVVCIGGVAYSARFLADPKYCSKVIHKVYKPSDDKTEKTRTMNARIAAAVVLVAFAYYTVSILLGRA
jgi:hypothetical protein